MSVQVEVRARIGGFVVGGRVLLDHAAGIDLSARLRQVGYVFQQYALVPHLSAGDNVGYALHRRPRAERAARVAELLSLVGPDGCQARRTSELSGDDAAREIVHDGQQP